MKMYSTANRRAGRSSFTVGGKLSLLATALVSIAGCGQAAPDPQGKEPSTLGDLGERRVIDEAERARMQRHLASLYDERDVLHRFTAASGDKIDCVAIDRQPALRQPDMSGHVIERAPRTFPSGSGLAAAPGSAPEDEQRSAEPPQDLLLRGDRDEDGAERMCPADTVPVLRLTMDTLERFRTLDEFRRKVPGHITPSYGPPDGIADRRSLQPELPDGIEPPARAGSTAFHQYAHAYQVVANMGAESYLNLWNPYTERSSEFSLSQIWVTRGGGSSLETVEAGGQKYRDLYGDYNARLFIYFTPDNYGSGGCYNLTCGAFVQTNSSIVIGGSFSVYSSTDGAQYDIKLLWYKDGTNGHWWLRYGNTWVGYYPRSRFDSNGLINSADYIDYGGEILDTAGDGIHTRTDMGSGAFASLGWQKAAFQRNILYVDTGNTYRTPSLTATHTDYWCYNILLYSSSSSWGTYFYAGGSGYNTECQ